VVIESPTKSCLPDPIPTFLLKECIDSLLPFLTTMVNASLSDGSFVACITEVPHCVAVAVEHLKTVVVGLQESPSKSTCGQSPT